jgi:hypothetical protein
VSAALAALVPAPPSVRSEIEVSYLRVLLHVSRQAVHQHPSLMQDQHAPNEFEDYLKVMLDRHHG